MATRGRPRAFDRDTALQRAMDVFWVRGYEGASLAALTEAMEIRPPSLYAAFGSKEGLFREALAHYLGQHGRYRRDVLDGAPSAREGVAELLRETVARFCSDEFPRGCLVVLAALTGTPESEAVRDALSAERGESIRLFRERMRRGIADGDLAADTDVEELATFYATVLPATVAGSAGDSCCRRRGIPAAPPAGRRTDRRAPVARGRWLRRVRRRPPAGSGRSARSAALRSSLAPVRRDGSRCSRLAGGSPCAGAVRRREARAGLHRGGNAVRRRSPGRPGRPARRTASGHGCRAARGSRCGGSPGRCRGRRRTARRRRPAGSTVVAVPA